VAGDPSCVSVNTTTHMANAVIDATGVEGMSYTYPVSGHVTCIGGDCDTFVTNTAILTGAGCEGLIDGSPATDSFNVTCAGGGGGGGNGPDPGDFCSQPQVSWGSSYSGNNPLAACGINTSIRSSPPASMWETRTDRKGMGFTPSY
jgi:hypothetical protein